MQDVHSIGDGGRSHAGSGGGTGAASDRRLRPQHNQTQQQALKCPRCDSLNTKFCYYNNYNLSQPRHFCKNCRRYWTKGGVLRNVPVGGGCRKTKRSKQKTSSVSVTVTTAPVLPPPSQDRKSNSHSSSESSSLTATNTNAATEAVSAPSTSSGSNLLSVNQESKFFVSQSTNASFEASALIDQSVSDCGIFSDIGSFTNLITSSSTGGGALEAFEYTSICDISISPFRLNQQNQDHHHHQVSQSQTWQQQNTKTNVAPPDHDQLKMQEITGGLLDQTSQADLSVLQDRSNGGVFGSLGDWQSCGDQGIFDLPNTVDQTYWGQSQWTDQDHTSVYLP
ncbi:hypothetical protein G4B88_018013 [Cannabis sativa]|uniref:Dof zinc finger protein n=1 Tax=Cannabis sativa TaxID=3483 RepID=A0A7J6HIP8_CANSA|nr:hypothetical protein G4B88_018013 [Cannabis sativa]